MDSPGPTILATHSIIAPCELHKTRVKTGKNTGKPNRIPPWITAGLLVGYCTIFWVGFVVSARWITEYISALLA